MTTPSTHAVDFRATGVANGKDFKLPPKTNKTKEPKKTQEEEKKDE